MYSAIQTDRCAVQENIYRKRRMNRYWAFDIQKNEYIPAAEPALSLFPTIVDKKQMTVYCRQHRQWERITAFSHNILTAACGIRYEGPFTGDKTLFNYGYDVIRRGNTYYIRVESQVVDTRHRRLLESQFELNVDRKVLYKEGKAVFESEDINCALCKKITDQLIDDIGELYHVQFGLKPGVASQLTGFNVILGYMLNPFNVNFYKIARHWGLNPYDKDFTSLSSGDTPDAENEMFSSLGIRPTKAVRKLYQQKPYGVICYAAAHDLGITDVNILQKTACTDFYNFLSFYMISFAGGDIQYAIRYPMRRFAADMLELVDQKTLWNSVMRTVHHFMQPDIPHNIISDGLNLYEVCAQSLTEREKKEILHEGFNTYTHDFLVRRQDGLVREGKMAMQAAEDNTPFPIEPQFLALEYKAGPGFIEDPVTKIRRPVADHERFCFYVAQNWGTLKKIGSKMHNCVGWAYKNAVQERRCTIVFAMYRDKYRICIEVTPEFGVRQVLGPCNKELTGEAMDAFWEWCSARHIIRSRVFKNAVMLAPV